jgi:hypothetical protein
MLRLLEALAGAQLTVSAILLTGMNAPAPLSGDPLKEVLAQNLANLLRCTDDLVTSQTVSAAKLAAALAVTDSSLADALFS